jgi:hypothetical protein
LVDSQTVKGADTVGADSRGYDAGKKINGRKRFIVTDTLGLLITVVVCTASMQDRDGAKPVLLQAYLASQVRFVFADGAFAGRLLEWATRVLRTTIHIVRKPTGQQGFAVIPRRWAVEDLVSTSGQAHVPAAIRVATSGRHRFRLRLRAITVGMCGAVRARSGCCRGSGVVP